MNLSRSTDIFGLKPLFGAKRLHCSQPNWTHSEGRDPALLSVPIWHHTGLNDCNIRPLTYQNQGTVIHPHSPAQVRIVHTANYSITHRDKLQPHNLRGQNSKVARAEKTSNPTNDGINSFFLGTKCVIHLKLVAAFCSSNLTLEQCGMKEHTGKMTSFDSADGVCRRRGSNAAHGRLFTYPI